MEVAAIIGTVIAGIALLATMFSGFVYLSGRIDAKIGRDEFERRHEELRDLLMGWKKGA